MESELRSIGELARDGGLSVSALRFYDGAGVLAPAWVDPRPGTASAESKSLLGGSVSSSPDERPEHRTNLDRRGALLVDAAPDAHARQGTRYSRTQHGPAQ